MVRSRGEAYASAFCLRALERPQFWMVHTREGGAELPATLDGLGELVMWTGNRVELRAIFERGEGFIQDPSSYRLCLKVADEIRKRGLPHRVVDLCASPGGKSASLAWAGMQVVATDIKAKRLERLRETAQYVGRGQVTVRTWEEVWQGGLAGQGIIWIDAPCSGSGTVQKHPEIKWTRGEVEWLELERVQLELLSRAAEWVRESATNATRLDPSQTTALVYSVCSVLKREGEDQIQRFLDAYPEWACEWQWHAPEWDAQAQNPNQLSVGDGFFAA